ncbi:peroxidase-like isoform X1 [Daphnia pulex]|nr:peroxidase-like isoform X1 [Daphnia pulex]XP_046453344.1 peroxidase-like isoform X1 [Daphnia pulex]
MDRKRLILGYVVLFLNFQIGKFARSDHHRIKRQIEFGANVDEFLGRSLFRPFSNEGGFIASQTGFDIRFITNAQLDAESSQASDRISDIIRFEESLIENEIRIQPNTAAFSHLKIVQPTADAQQLAREALLVIEATRQLQRKFNLTPVETGLDLTFHSTRQTIQFPACRSKPPCMQHFGSGVKYRTIDGSCNNLEKPSWGMARSTFQRILPPAYSDGVFAPRIAMDGTTLPSARFISLVIVSHHDAPRADLSLLWMVFGQFIDHDLTLSPTFVLSDNSGIECCSADGGSMLPESSRHPQCLPIEIPADDPFYRNFNQRCMNFVRTTPGLRPDCNFGYAEQLNELTHWLDGSQIYGSDAETMTKLRDFHQGRLRSTRFNGRSIVPLDPKSNVTRTEDCKTSSCYIAGDIRVTEQPQLTVIHTLWMREHNQIAAELSRLNPGWSDENIFQEARRIVIAEYQFIIYNEFLPIILGKRYMDTFNLSISQSSLYYGNGDYDATIDPSIQNEFATAAYRMGHSLVQGLVKLFSQSGQVNEESSFTLSNMLDAVSPIGKDSAWMDEALRGLLEQPMQNFDSSFTPEITNKLFRGEKPFGMDLVALNIQRGRDHGIPGYNSYREICGMKRADHFRGLSPQIPDDMITQLKHIYRSVDDVDLFVGGILETPVYDSLVGPTFLCIIGDQFARLKKADRFFYDAGNQLHSFNQRQIEEIRKASLARIICDHSDGTIRIIQPLALRTPGEINGRKRCDGPSISRLNFEAWAGEPIF